MYKARMAKGERTWKQAGRPARRSFIFIRLILLWEPGVKKGKPAKELEDFFCRSLKSLGLRKEQVEKIGSIDRKAEEEGFIELADQWNIPFETWPEEVLKQIENVSRESGFVRQVTGIGNVCERAAIQGSKNGGCFLKKQQKTA